MDMEQLMAQAAALQDKVAVAQEKLGKTKIIGISGDGACVVEMTGKYDLIKMQISPDIVSRGAHAVEKFVGDAYRDAKRKADEIIDRVMADATAGMPMPK